MRIIVDSDAYIAIYNKNDFLHKMAIKILHEIKQADTLFTTWDVIDETATKLSYFLSKTAAKKFINDLHKSSTNIIYPTEKLLLETINRFSSIRTKKVSFTDSFNMVVFDNYDIDKIFSFDKNYKKQGLSLIQ